MNIRKKKQKKTCCYKLPQNKTSSIALGPCGHTKRKNSTRHFISLYQHIQKIQIQKVKRDLTVRPLCGLRVLLTLCVTWSSMRGAACWRHTPSLCPSDRHIRMDHDLWWRVADSQLMSLTTLALSSEERKDKGFEWFM